MLKQLEEDYCNEMEIWSGQKNPNNKTNKKQQTNNSKKYIRRKEIIEERSNRVTKTEEGRKKRPG